MKRGEVWWVNFDPAVGSEIKKTRPAVIISNDTSNTHSSRVQVVPASSQLSKIYPPECVIVVGGKTAKIMADQIMTVSKSRLYNKIGILAEEDMKDIERVIKLQLGMR